MGGPSTWPTHPASQPNGRSQNRARDTRPATFMGGTGSSPGRLQGSGPVWGWYASLAVAATGAFCPQPGSEWFPG